MASLPNWRRSHKLTQAQAASLLGVSQPYLSLLEKGARPLTDTVRARMKSVGTSQPQASLADHFREQLSALGYPPFAHVPAARVKPLPDAFLLSVLTQPNVDARVVEALPWVIRTYVAKMNLPWLIQQAKLRNLQNQMGFLFQASGPQHTEFAMAVDALEKARLLEEATLCWNSMPAATRNWMRAHRSSLAKHWNLATMLRPEQSQHAA
jgi:transcriptional regulator with XRE-family HTH domain